MALQNWRDMVWSLKAKRQRYRWYLAPVRWRVGDTRVYLLPGRCWDEFWIQTYGRKFAILARVVPAGSVPTATPEQREKIAMGIFDKLPAGKGSGVPSPLPNDPPFVKHYPTIWEFMTADQYGPDQPRERSALTIRVEEGVFKLFLGERTKELGIDATGTTFVGAMAALEARISSEAPGWRSTAKPARKKR